MEVFISRTIPRHIWCISDTNIDRLLQNFLKFILVLYYAKMRGRMSGEE
jgi:hypothetical protein